ncbi:MAG TPA: hypothetical protein VEJ41_02900 [Candidatus Acidoferrales bacterium]|nr:hypothetical protein [Candidatus Acidoferrales bacterium]
MLLWTRGSADVGPGQPATAALGAPPSGLAVVIENVPQSPLDLHGLRNQYMSGAALQIHWSDLEPAEGKFDWAKLDRLFSEAQTQNKWVQLLIFPGFFTPSWALQGVQTGQFAIQYGPGQGTVEALPVPWDSVYLNRWFRFLSRLSARYGTSPAFRVIAAAGPTSVSAEFTLPKSPSDVRQWQSLGYTPSKYTGAWHEVFQTYAADFPNQYISLSAGSGQIDIDDAGKIVHGGQETVRQTLIDDAMNTIGRRFVLQSSNLHAGAGPHEPDSQTDDAVVINYAGRIVTGLQMRTSAMNGSAVMGADGDPALALRRSVDLGMETNADGQHINYLEIYNPDVIAPETQSVLQYAASLFTSRPPPRPGSKPPQ